MTADTNTGRPRFGRRSIRLKGYDYSQAGAYFVTVCTHRRACLFGEIVGDAMRPNACGTIVMQAWDVLPTHYPHVALDAFVVMPNHVHGIVLFADDTLGAGLKPAPTHKHHALSEIVRAFKTFSARTINERRATPGAPVWQRNYYEHVVRDETALNRIREYIANNPARWADDPDNPQTWRHR